MIRTLILSFDLKTLPKYAFLVCLLLFPFFAYVIEKTIESGMNVFKAFGLICILFLFFKGIEIYRNKSSLIIPLYLVIFGVFVVYTMFCGMFMTNYFEERGIKYFFSDPIWLTFIGLIAVENIQISKLHLNSIKKVLWVTLILASITAIVQISNPFFLVNDSLFVQGLSYDRLVDYYQNSNAVGLSKSEMGQVSRFFKGYRMSVFSYINLLSVGIDTLAIFSILLAFKPQKPINKSVLIVATAIVSFLSSARWIILGFMIISSQLFLLGANKLSKLFYFIIYGLLLLLILCGVAYFSGFDVERFITERMMANSASTRLLAFEVFFEVFPNSPILGTGGVDTEEMTRLLGGKSSQIHVGFLKLFYYYGLIGGLLYTVFMVAFLTRLRKMAKISNYWGGFFAILVFFVANLTLYELSLFYFGPLLSIIIANYFYRKKIECVNEQKLQEELVQQNPT